MTDVFLVTPTLPQLFLNKRLTERANRMSQGLKDISAAIWAVPLFEIILRAPATARWQRSVGVFMGAITIGANGYGGESVAMTAGFVVPPGAQLTAKTTPSLDMWLWGAALRGYLAPDK